MVFVADRAVVKPRIEEEFGRDILVEIEGEGILPLPLRVLVGGETIHARLIGDVLGDGPFQIDGELRTEIVEDVLVSVKSETCGEPSIAAVKPITIDILHVVCKGSEVDGTGEFLVPSLHVVIHTE